MKYAGIFLVALVLLITSCRHHEGLKASDRIFDQANLLTDDQEDSLITLINAVDKDLGPQIGIVTVDSLGGQDIGMFAVAELKKLGLGRKGFNDGLLITVALREKQVRIDPGPGLRRVIPDDMQGTLIRNTIAPEFKDKHYFEGLRTGIIQIHVLMEQNRSLIGVPL